LAHLGHLGFDVRAIGAVGDDNASDIVLRDLQDFRIDACSVERVPGVDTGRDLHQVVVDGHLRGRRRISMSCDTCRRVCASPVRPGGSHHGWASAAEAVVFIADWISADTIDFAEANRQRGGLNVYTPSARTAESSTDLRTIASNVDLVVFPADEPGSADLLLSRLDDGAVTTIETLGIEGIRVSSRGLVYPQPPSAALVVADPVGFGDAFLAWLLAAWIRSGARLSSIADIDDLLTLSAQAQRYAALATLFVGGRGLIVSCDTELIHRAMRSLAAGGRPPAGIYQASRADLLFERKRPSGRTLCAGCLRELASDDR
jgi:sugar/nucleoside kinase (ribokinase family)